MEARVERWLDGVRAERGLLVRVLVVIVNLAERVVELLGAARRAADAAERDVVLAAERGIVRAGAAAPAFPPA